MGKKDAGPPSGYTAPGQGDPGTFQQAATAEAQGNRPNQNTDFGSTGWKMDPGTGQWTQNTRLNSSLGSTLFNLQNQGNQAWQNPLDSGESARTKASDSWYNQEKSRLDPQWNQAGDAMQTQLTNQGFVPGTEAYDKAYGNFSRAKTDAYQTANNNAIQQGGNAAQQQQQMDLTRRNAPFSMMQLLQGLTSMPGFNAGPRYLDAAMGTSNYNLQNQQMSNQGWGNLMGGLFNLGGTLGGAGILKSDARLKTDIRRLAREAIPGVPLVLFRYKSDPSKRYIGVLAQDVEKVEPESVFTGPDGFKYVHPKFAPMRI